MAAGVVTDTAGNAFAGLLNNNDWAFETKALSTSISWTGATADNYINNIEQASDALSGTITSAGATPSVEKIELFEVGDNNVKFTIVKANITLNNKLWSVSAANMPTLLDGKTYTAKIFLKDGVTEVSQDSAPVIYDFTAPEITISTVATDDIINAC